MVRFFPQPSPHNTRLRFFNNIQRLGNQPCHFLPPVRKLLFSSSEYYQKYQKKRLSKNHPTLYGYSISRPSFIPEHI
jgi:hypothetical protein